MQKDSYIIRLTGKAELPKPIEVENNYHLSLEGSVVSEEKATNEDGSFLYTYKFRPVKVDLLEPKGEMLKLKDTRKESQKLRAKLYRVWEENDDERSFDDFYNDVMARIRLNAETIIEQYGE